MSIYKGHKEPAVHYEWVPLVRKGKLTIETMVKVCEDVLNSKEDSKGAPDLLISSIQEVNMKILDLK